MVATRRPKHQERDRSLESELKFRLIGPGDHAQLRAQLRRKSAQDLGAYDEENLRFHGRAKPRRTSLRLRVLDGGPAGMLTTKGPARFLRGIKIREETEVAVGDSHAARDLLEDLGYLVAFTYHKHRSTWRLGQVVVALDTLDFGCFVELEGPSEVLEDAARELGLDPARAIRESYAAIARRWLPASHREAPLSALASPSGSPN